MGDEVIPSTTYFIIIIKRELICNNRSPRAYSKIETKYINWKLLTKKQQTFIVRNTKYSAEGKIFQIDQHKETYECIMHRTQEETDKMVKMITIINLAEQDLININNTVFYFVPTWPCTIIGIGYTCVWTY